MCPMVDVSWMLTQHATCMTVIFIYVWIDQLIFIHVGVVTATSKHRYSDTQIFKYLWLWYNLLCYTFTFVVHIANACNKFWSPQKSNVAHNQIKCLLMTPRAVWWNVWKKKPYRVIPVLIGAFALEKSIVLPFQLILSLYIEPVLV